MSNAPEPRPPEQPCSSVSSNPPPAENDAQQEEVLELECLLQELEEAVAEEVQNALQARGEGTWDDDDDNIFHSFSMYVEYCWRRRISQRASALWLARLSPATAEAEQILQGREGQHARIHKGSPYFNVGLSFFMSGDFDRAMVFIGEAGEEDQRSGRANAGQVLIGNNVLSERILIDPIALWLCAPNNWGSQYQAVTAGALDKAELQRVLTWASARLTDALQLIVSLQRLANTHVLPDNAAHRHLRMQVLSDLVVVVESTLRRWQGRLPGNPHLHDRLVAMLPGGSGMERSFGQMHNDFVQRYPRKHQDREAAVALNWTIDECLGRIAASGSASERAGLASYLTVRLRNSLMHVMDEAINLYSDPEKFFRCACLVFSTVRLSMHGEQGSLGGL